MRFSSVRQLIAIIPWFTLVLVLSACAPTAEQKPTTGSEPTSTSKSSGPLRLGVVTWVGSGPFYLARQHGLFGELEVEISIIDDSAARRSALAQGSIDAMLATVDDFANAAAAGLPGIAIFKSDDSMGGDGLVAAPDIQSVADLAGRQVAFPQGMPSHFFLLHLLHDKGLDVGLIEKRYMDAGDAGAAFVAGQVDAAVTWEPWLSKATERQGGHVLATTREYPGLIADIVVANKDRLNVRREDFRALVRGWLAALDLWRSEPEGSNAAMAEALGLEQADFEAMLGGIRYADAEENRRYFGVGSSEPPPIQQVFESASEVWQMEGLVNEAPSFAQHVDPSLLAELN